MIHVKLSVCHTLSEYSVNAVYCHLPDSGRGAGDVVSILWSRGQQAMMAHGLDQCLLSK